MVGVCHWLCQCCFWALSGNGPSEKPRIIDKLGCCCRGETLWQHRAIAFDDGMKTSTRADRRPRENAARSSCVQYPTFTRNVTERQPARRALAKPVAHILATFRQYHAARSRQNRTKQLTQSWPYLPASLSNNCKFMQPLHFLAETGGNATKNFLGKLTSSPTKLTARCPFNFPQVKSVWPQIGQGSSRRSTMIHNPLIYGGQSNAWSS